MMAFGAQELPVRRGLLNTITPIAKLPLAQLVKCASHLGAIKTRDRTKLVRVIQYALQIAWYQSKHESIPSTINDRYQLALQEARVIDPQTPYPSASDAATVSPTPAPAPEQKKSRGARPLIRSLIGAGKSNEEILAEVQAAFPGVAVKMADVTWQRKQLEKAS